MLQRWVDIVDFRFKVPGNFGADLSKPMVGRGAAFADKDGDGDMDVLITANGQTPRLLRNDQQLGNHWLRLKLVGSRTSRDAIGSQVSVQVGDRVLNRQVMPTRGYLSQSELVVTFGLGAAAKVDKVTIRWTDGSVAEILHPAVDTVITVQQNLGPANGQNVR